MTARLLVPELVLLPGGAFVMGNDNGRPDERPAHRVTVGTFWAGTRPVSNAEYAVFVESAGYEAPPFIEEPRFALPDQPVAGVSWFDAVAYCDWLTRETGRRFRLPSEAEREYAALGGLESVDWPWGNDSPDADAERAEVGRFDMPHAPRAICRNGHGLYCMADNVHEWCSDWYDAAYYASSPEEAPKGPTTGLRRASRGGSWRHQVRFNRIVARSSLNPSFHYNDYGFRVCADVWDN